MQIFNTIYLIYQKRLLVSAEKNTIFKKAENNMVYKIANRNNIHKTYTQHTQKYCKNV